MDRPVEPGVQASAASWGEPESSSGAASREKGGTGLAVSFLAPDDGEVNLRFRSGGRGPGSPSWRMQPKPSALSIEIDAGPAAWETWRRSASIRPRTWAASATAAGGDQASGELGERGGGFLDQRDWDGWLDLYLPEATFWIPMWDTEYELTCDPQSQLSLMWYGDRSGLEDRVFRIETDRSSASTPDIAKCIAFFNQVSLGLAAGG